MSSSSSSSSSATPGVSITPGVANNQTKKGPERPAYRFVLTVNNYTDVDLQVCQALYEDEDVVCMVVGNEVSSTGTPHLQMYLRTIKPHRWSHWKKRFPGSHIEIAHGTDEENLAYCSKESTLYRKEPPEHTTTGRKRDRDAVCSQVIEEIEEGRNFGAIRQRHKVFCFWHRRNVLEYKRDEDFLESNPNEWPV